jgi:hypothetical protein
LASLNLRSQWKCGHYLQLWSRTGGPPTSAGQTLHGLSGGSGFAPSRLSLALHQRSASSANGRSTPARLPALPTDPDSSADLSDAPARRPYSVDPLVRLFQTITRAYQRPTRLSAPGDLAASAPFGSCRGPTRWMLDVRGLSTCWLGALGTSWVYQDQADPMV